MHNLCFSFLLGMTAVLREIENNAPIKRMRRLFEATRLQQERRLKSKFAFFQSLWRLFLPTYFVNCRRTVLKLNFKGPYLILGLFPFVRTDRPDHSRRNDNFRFNQNSTVRSRSGQIGQTLNSMREGERFSAKTLRTSLFHFQTDWSGNAPAGQFWKMESDLRKRNKISSLLVYVLQNAKLGIFTS